MRFAPAMFPAVLEEETLAARGVRRGVPSAASPAVWQLSSLAGRLTEISGHHATAGLTLVFRLVFEAQKQGEPVALIHRVGSVFFPPDEAEVGVDLEALAVIRVDGTLHAARAADHLLRSGGFGLVVLDLGPSPHFSLPVQVRLSGLAKKHGSALLCLTEKERDRPSLGGLVSLRAEAARSRKVGDGYRCEALVLKDKRRGPGWRHAEVCRGPDGLC